MKGLWGEFIGGRAAWGLLAIRLVFGGALVLHGMQKIGAPTSWMNPFAPGVPALFQFLAFFSELAGGLALLFGLLTPLAALGVIATMLVATFMAHGGDPWVATGGGKSREPALGYLAFALLMLLTGPGRFSLDALFLGRVLATEIGYNRFSGRLKPAEARNTADEHKR